MQADSGPKAHLDVDSIQVETSLREVFELLAQELVVGFVVVVSARHDGGLRVSHFAMRRLCICSQGEGGFSGGSDSLSRDALERGAQWRRGRG